MSPIRRWLRSRKDFWRASRSLATGPPPTDGVDEGLEALEAGLGPRSPSGGTPAPAPGATPAPGAALPAGGPRGPALLGSSLTARSDRRAPGAAVQGGGVLRR